MVAAILALILLLVLVVVPNRNTLWAKSWLDWQKSVEISAAKCKKSSTPETCLSKELASVLVRRPKPAQTATPELASAVIAGQVLLANETIRKVLSERLSIDERFIGAGNSEPIRHTNAAAARVPEYLVPNLPTSAPLVWVWKLSLDDLMRHHLLLDNKLIEVLLNVAPEPRTDGTTFAKNWGWISSDHLASDDTPALVRFALLDPSNSRGDSTRRPSPSGCLGGSRPHEFS